MSQFLTSGNDKGGMSIARTSVILNGGLIGGFESVSEFNV